MTPKDVAGVLWSVSPALIVFSGKKPFPGSRNTILGEVKLPLLAYFRSQPSQNLVSDVELLWGTRNRYKLVQEFRIIDRVLQVTVQLLSRLDKRFIRSIQRIQLV